MSEKKKSGGRRLGKGLDALLSKEASEALAAGAEQVMQVPVAQITPSPYQPRKHFDPETLLELANSIREHGVLQPIVLRALPEGGYELVAGERRWRAAQMVELETVAAICVRLDDRQAQAVALIENIQRDNLHPIELAQSYQRLIEEHGYTHNELAQTLGKSRAAISNMMRLTKLSGEVREMFTRGDLEMGHARALLGLDRQEQQLAAAREVVQGRLSVREVEALVKRLNRGGGGGGGGGRGGGGGGRDANLDKLERDLAEHLGAPLNIKMRGKSAGTLAIRFGTSAQFEGLLKKVGFKKKD